MPVPTTVVGPLEYCGVLVGVAVAEEVGLLEEPQEMTREVKPIRTIMATTHLRLFYIKNSLFYTRGTRPKCSVDFRKYGNSYFRLQIIY
jgi:hypothetical protein